MLWAYVKTIEVALARDIKASLPLAVVDVIQSDEWKGGPLVALKDNISRPTADELSKNAMWLLAVVQHSPAKARGFQI